MRRGITLAVIVTGLAACSAPAPALPSVPSAPALTVQQWVAGAGPGQLAAVRQDVNAITADANYQVMPSLFADGARLATDASIAAANPYPGNPAAYTALMNDLSDDGTSITAAGFTGNAVSDVTATAAALNQPL